MLSSTSFKYARVLGSENKGRCATFGDLWSDNAELFEMSAHCVDQLLSDQCLAHLMDRQGALLFPAPGRTEPHARPLHRLDSIGPVVLLTLDVMQRHQSSRAISLVRKCEQKQASHSNHAHWQMG